MTKFYLVRVFLYLDNVRLGEDGRYGQRLGMDNTAFAPNICHFCTLAMYHRI